MPDLLAWGFAITLAAMTAVNPSRVHAQSLDGQTLAGAFVTMTRGARCPSTSSIAFSAQGEAIGRIDGIFDARGTIDLALGDNSRGPSVVAMSAQLDFNQKKVPGSLVWDPADPPLGITCDPLSMRIEGRLRYTITDPFEAQGAVDMLAYGSRDAVTQPYFGRTVMSFVPAPLVTQPR
ncbi:MAG: hypothetical protein ABL971_09760 [Vicinamibacterales bacterium]